jgi:hypothetical protein
MNERADSDADVDQCVSLSRAAKILGQHISHDVGIARVLANEIDAAQRHEVDAAKLHRREHGTHLGRGGGIADVQPHTNRHTKISRERSKHVHSCPDKRSRTSSASRWRADF